MSETRVPKGTLYSAILVSKAETTDRPMRLFLGLGVQDIVFGASVPKLSNLLPFWRCSPTQREATTDKTSRILQEALDLSS